MGLPSEQDCAAAAGMQSQVGYEKDRAIAGAADIIRLERGTLNRNMRVYSRGVVVGCTYISRDAIREIWRRFQEQQ